MAHDAKKHDARSQAFSSHMSSPHPSSARENPQIWTVLSHRDRQKKRAAEQSRIDELYSSMVTRFQLRQNSRTPLQRGRQAGESAHEIGTDNARLNAWWSWPWRHTDPWTDIRAHWLRVLAAVAAPLPPSSGANRVRSVLALTSLLVQLIVVPLSIVNLLNMAWLPAIEQASAAVLAVDTLLVFNTAFVTSNGQLETSRRRIAEHYASTWLVFDLLSCIPSKLLLRVCFQHTHLARPVLRPLAVLLHGVFRAPRLEHNLRLFRAAWISLAVGVRSSSGRLGVASWVLFSRYSHLLGVGAIVKAVLLLVHYMACAWVALTDMDQDPDAKPFAVYMRAFYIMLQLLHGQGVDTHTPLENLFASASILLGALVFAIVYGHIGMLVDNFYSNETAYQRKAERVFATMEKLGLPAPLRTRINEYYAFMHRQYESLDNEVDRFARDLSHTLQLETVLTQYMELFTQIPFWSHCSADFQRQLALYVRLRVYLPDDYVMRRGEVGDEFYMVNKGTCELVTGPDSFEHASGSTGTNIDNTERAGLLATSRRTGRRLLGGGVRGDPSTVITRLRRGQAVGEIALVMNYERTATCRAVTPVEIAVVRREDFQRTMVRYPEDRAAVIHAIFGTCLHNNEAHRVHCPLTELVRSVVRERHPTRAVTATQAAEILSRAANPELADESLRFGVSSMFLTRLAAAAQVSNHVPSPSSEVAGSEAENDDAHSCVSFPGVADTSTGGVGELAKPESVKGDCRASDRMPLRQREHGGAC